MRKTHMNRNPTTSYFMYVCFVAICFALASCTVSLPFSSSSATTCQSNCLTGTGAQGVRVYVEPDDGEQVITGAIKSASKSVWLEMYILSDRNVIRALEEAAKDTDRHGLRA